MKENSVRIAVLIAVFGSLAFVAAAEAGMAEPIYMVDTPTAGLLSHGEYHIQGRIGPESSVLLGFRVGVKNRVFLGVSFGMQNLFSYEQVDLNDRPGLQLRVRLLEEDDRRPGLALGFNSQGTGAWNDEAERYDRKSKGFYAVLSRNWKIPVGHFSLHGGLNYTLENQDQDNANVFAAADWEAITGLEFILDFDAAFNDDTDDDRFGGGGVYLDGAIRVTYGENLQLMLVFRDLTKNYTPERRIGRELEIAFVDFF
jgi:hypothetical protein